VAKTGGEVMTLAQTAPPLNQVADVRSIPNRRLIRAGLLMLLFMTTAFAAATWNTVEGLASQMKALPIVLFVVVCILVVQLYARVDEIAVVQHNMACAVECASDPLAPAALNAPENSISPLQITQLSQVSPETRNEIWNHWDRSGTGRESIGYVSSAHGIASNVVQHLLERYDVRWREQLVALYQDNPRNEYTAYIGVEKNQIAEDALRLKSGLPIYPVAGVWLCTDCHKRPCQCDLGTSKGARATDCTM
jgi:hypothetical protein